VASAAIGRHPGLLDAAVAWDLRTAARPDKFVAISTVVAERIRQIYGREAAIVPPPVDTARFRHLSGQPGDYYLIMSRLNAYERLHLAVQAFIRLRLPLFVAGEGPHRATLERMAGPTVRFLGLVTDEAAGRLLSGCRALIFPGVAAHDHPEAAGRASCAMALAVGFATQVLFILLLADEEGRVDRTASNIRDTPRSCWTTACPHWTAFDPTACDSLSVHSSSRESTPSSAGTVSRFTRSRRWLGVRRLC
jgi:glycosyltransferase involved in cell wall biosynthesis